MERFLDVTDERLPRRALGLPPPLQRALWALLLLVFLGSSLLLPPAVGDRPEPIPFLIEPGMGSVGIAAHLERLGLVRSRWAFLFVAWTRGAVGRLRAGPYKARASESLWTLADRLKRGDVVDMAVTIPEGFNAREIGARLAPVLGFTVSDFLAAVHDSSLADSLGVPIASLEGYLFPDTYRFIPGVTPRGAVVRMASHMLALLEPLLAGRADSSGLSRHQLLTLASLVEAEARMPEERPRIAAVFLNRLRTGMKLQSDPTVAYALGTRPARIFQKDLAVESPYNTYLVYGLPPGPICSPGGESVRAVLNPLAGCRDLYFVASGDGHHIFSETNEAHNQARRRVAGGQGASRGGGR